ncbi:hypothetical protein UFOVP53_188 [uncultured Caudovirales phage]|uniref:Uncharacterized protein n=1 Tax=uncultured Caudovirales phage TaxID=2100421 RepID=A0A6J5L0M3_9CAUD|nr:hypothetical protein UFOVP53_188 [uncultured Caudovirales phage]
MKQFYMSLMFLAVLLQVVACSSAPEKITEEDKQAIKNRFPSIQSHRNLDKN